MKRKGYFADPVLATVAMCTWIFLVAASVVLFTISRPVSAAIFIAVSVIFIHLSVVYGRRVYADARGITVKLLWITLANIPWNEIREIGVTNTKIFRKKKSKKTGSLYIYFSRKSMNDDERFGMMLKWPPKDKLFIPFSRKKYEHIQLMSDRKFVFYNADEAKFFIS